MIPAKVEVRLGASAPNGISFMGAASAHKEWTTNGSSSGSSNTEHNRMSSKPIDILQSSSKQGAAASHTPSSTPLKGNDRRQKPTQNRRTVAYTKNQAFGTPVDDPTMIEDFDFEKNLALFDKQAIWDEIDAIQKPDLLRQTMFVKNKNYRHDENVLLTAPTGYRQITTDYQSSMEFATDDGLIIPTISKSLRTKIQQLAAENGLSWARQCDMLARGTSEMAILLLGGARRLTPKNQHQWPTIVIISDGEETTDDLPDVGISTGRQLASHGLQICIYFQNEQSPRQSTELKLYSASINTTQSTNIHGTYI